MRSPPTDADVKFNQNQRDKVYRSVKADAPGFRRIPCGRKMFRGARWIDRATLSRSMSARVGGVSAPVPRGRFGSCSLRSLSGRGGRPRRFITSEGDHGAFRDRMNHYGRAKSRLRDSGAVIPCLLPSLTLHDPAGTLPQSLARSPRVGEGESVDHADEIFKGDDPKAGRVTAHWTERTELWWKFTRVILRG